MSIPLEDRLAISDLLKAYCWAFDTGDADGVVACFTPDGAMKISSGERFDGRDAIRAFCRRDFASPQGRGRQHWIQEIDHRPQGAGWLLRSYWSVFIWNGPNDARQLRTIGHSTDLCVKLDGRWLIKERLLWRWNDKDQPWVG